MSKLPDIELPTTVDNETKDMLYYIRLYWNNGRYDLTKYSVSPSTDTAGNEGEMRFVREGNNGYLFVYDNTDWWYGTLTKLT